MSDNAIGGICFAAVMTSFVWGIAWATVMCERERQITQRMLGRDCSCGEDESASDEVSHE